MTTVRSALLVGVAVLTCVSPVTAQLPFEDPQALYESTLAALGRGDIEQAGSTLTAIRLLLEADPGWDPDGSFSQSLIPRLADRLARLEKASASLEALRHSIGEEADPEFVSEADDLARSLEWGSSLARRVKNGTALVAESVPPGPERGALLQSQALQEIRGLVQDRVLPYMTDALSGRISEVIERDEQIGIMRERMESLKQEVMALTLEREKLREELTGAREGQAAYLSGLIRFIAADLDPAEAIEAPVLSDVESVLARRVRERLLEVRSLEEQTLVRKTLLLEELTRFRFVNEAVVAEGGRNNTGRIDLLAAAIEKVQVRAGGIDRLLSSFGQ